MITLDSSFIIQLIRQNIQAIEVLDSLKSNVCATTSINIFEIWVGFYQNKQLDQKPEYRELVKSRTKSILEKLAILHLGIDEAETSAKILGNLIKDGKDIGDKDSLIGGIMKYNGSKYIITENKKHFKRIEGIIPLSYIDDTKKIQNLS